MPKKIEDEQNMILRTWYASKELDRRLTLAAFAAGVSKGNIIRKAVEKELRKRQAATLRAIRVCARKASSKPKAKRPYRTSLLDRYAVATLTDGVPTVLSTTTEPA